MTPAERLLAAADLLAKRAGEAAQPWEMKDDNHLALPMIEMPHTIGRTKTSSKYTVAGPDDATTQYIATMHPGAGKAVAAWLRAEAERVINGPLAFGGPPLFTVAPSALALADLLLAGES